MSTSHARSGVGRILLRTSGNATLFVTFDWTDVTGAANYTIQIDDNNPSVTTSSSSTSTLPTRTMWWMWWRVRG